MFKSHKVKVLSGVAGAAIMASAGVVAALLVAGPSAAIQKSSGGSRHVPASGTTPPTPYRGVRVAVPKGTPPWLVPCYEDSAAVPLKTCLAGGKARRAQQQAQFPSAQVSGGTEISEAQAFLIARNGSPLATASTPEYGQLTTYLHAENMMGEPSPSNPYIDPATPVWIVTVMAPAVDFSPPAMSAASKVFTQKMFTEVIDAANGSVADYCGGCHSVGP